MTIVRNDATNPSFEGATTTATAVPGTSGTAALTNPTNANAYAGTKALLCTWSVASTAAGGGVYAEYTLAALGYVVGDTISVGLFRARSSIGNRLQFSLEFRTDVTTVSTSSATDTQVTAATNYGAAADAWLKRENVVIPATTTRIRLRLLSIAGTGYANWSIAATLLVDAVMINKGATLKPYVDGSLGPMYEWMGVANASASQFYTPVVTLTAQPEDALPPRVEIVVQDVPGETITVRQIADDSVDVRDAIRIPSGVSTLSTDYEAPLGVTITYRVEMFDLAGNSLGLTAPVTVQLDGDEGFAYMQDPLAPKSWVKLQAEAKFADRLGKHRDVAYLRRGPETVALMGELGLLEGLSLRVVSQTPTDEQRMAAVVEQGYVLVRTMPGIPVPRALHAIVGDPVKVPWDARVGRNTMVWDITGNEVSRSLLGVIEPVLTWARFKAAFSTMAAAKAVYATYIDAKRNPPPEV